MSLGAGEVAVDIVIDNYNYARYLAEAIESARGQTHPNVSVIVVDDGSTDDSREVLAGYEDQVTVVAKENGGQASALNAGLSRSAGDVVFFLDADDVLKPDAASRAAAAFAADDGLAKVQFRMEVIDAEGRPTGMLKPDPHLPLPQGDMSQAELSHPFDIVWLAMSANAFRADVLRRVMPIPEEPFQICADWYLVHTTALLGRVASLPSVGACYRLHGSNSYAPQADELDLDHLRETIAVARETSEALLNLAGELGLPRPARIVSLADLANRLISLRLAPQRHPLPDDSRARILADAVTAVRRRTDVSFAMKGIFGAWFTATALVPRPIARRLALAFLFPGRRVSFNRFLARMHGKRRNALEATG